MNYKHIPVLKNEVISYLDLRSNQNVIDLSVGGGGHSKEILEKTVPKGQLIGLDWDNDAIAEASKRLSKYKNRVHLFQSNYKKITKIKNERFALLTINAVLLDLGFSSITLEGRSRGFSFKNDGPLDMRYAPEEGGQTAADILNYYSLTKLEKIFREYGGEKFAKKIAFEITNKRKKQKFFHTKDLLSVVLQVYKDKLKSDKEVPYLRSGLHPATKIFQALRIEVNQELENLKQVLPQALKILEKGGRLAIISFHSLEDRIVKNFFRDEARDCLCPPEIPACRCGHVKKLKIITKKAIRPGKEEIKFNHRSRSALLRVAEKI